MGIFKGYSTAKYYKCMKLSSSIIQRSWRCYRFKSQFFQTHQRKNASVRIQNWWRSSKSGKLDRKKFLESRRAAVIIQSVWRGYFVRRCYTKMLHEHKIEVEQKKVKESADAMMEECFKETLFAQDRVDKLSIIPSISDES